MRVLVHLHLFNDKNRAEADVMLAVMMAKSNGKNFPSFDTSIDCFVASTGTVHEILMRVIFRSVLRNALGLSCITLVSNHFFSSREHALHLEPKDLDIVPSTSIEWTGVGDDVASKDANANLVAQASILEFCGVPGRVEWTGLDNHEVHTINGDEASLSGIANEAVFPPNL